MFSIRLLVKKFFLWNLMINEYARIGDFGESIRLFRKMQELGIEANSYMFSCVLKRNELQFDGQL